MSTEREVPVSLLIVMGVIVGALLILAVAVAVIG